MFNQISDMKTKNIIQRALPLNVKYELLGVSYISIEDGGGCGCDNCGRLICNVATVKTGDKVYNIGTDCLETVLLNNQLLDTDSRVQYLFSDKPAIAKAKSLRSKILAQRKKDATWEAVIYISKKESDTFGFSFSAEVSRTWAGQTEATTYRDPRGFDFTFDMKYKDLTLAYINGLPGLVLNS